jgi:KDO2-lipid IV(A) lauroyltransferase
MKAAAWSLEGFRLFAKRGWRASCTASLLRGGLNLFAPRGKRILSNLALVYPESDGAWRANIRRRLYNHLAWMVTEMLALQRDPAQALEWVEEVHNFCYVEELLDEKKGAIFLSGHYGNWELLAAWYAQFLKKRGLHNYHAIVQNVKDKDIDRLITSYRRSAGVNTLLKQTSTLEMVKLLKGGAHISTMTDVSWSGGLVLPFMGRPCTNSIGPAVLGLLASVPIIPVAIYRRAPFRHKAVFSPPLQMPEETDRRVKIEIITRRINSALEKIIAPQPELWFWLHNRWK